MSRSSRRALFAFFCVLACVLAWHPSARADAPPSPPSQEQVEAARVPFREARDLETQGRLNDAANRMLDAYKVASTPVIALHAGSLLAQVGRLLEARGVLQGVGSMPVSPRESDAGRDARRDAAALASQLDGRIPRLSILDRPPRVDVLLDGKAVLATDTPVAREVDPGVHTFVVTQSGRVCVSITVTLAETEVRQVDLRDAARSCPADAAPPAPPPVAPPRLDAEARPAPAPPVPPRSPDVGRITGVISLGAGIAAVGVGAVVLVGAKHDYDSVAASCTAQGCTRDAFDVRDAAHSHANAATVAMGIGAAAVAAGIVLWLSPWKHHDAAAGPPRAGQPRVGIGPSSAWLSVPFQ